MQVDSNYYLMETGNAYKLGYYVPKQVRAAKAIDLMSSHFKLGYDPA
jgi:hypothetical protein